MRDQVASVHRTLGAKHITAPGEVFNQPAALILGPPRSNDVVTQLYFWDSACMFKKMANIMPFTEEMYYTFKTANKAIDELYKIQL